MGKTARERYDEMRPIGPDSPDHDWHARMRLYCEVLGDESSGMSVYEYMTYLALPWDEKLAYSQEVKKKKE